MSGQPSIAIQGDTFLRSEPAKIEDLVGSQLAVVGVPHEITKVSRGGCSRGPAAIREATLLFDFLVRRMAESDIVDIDRSLAWRYNSTAVVDVGDLTMGAQVEVNGRTIREAMQHIRQNGATPVMLGGDHYITYPAVAGVRQAISGDLAYVHVDMHTDIYDVVPGFGPHSGGSVVHRLIEDGVIEGQRTLLYGLDPLLAREEWDYMQSQGVKFVTNSKIVSEGVEATLRPALAEITAGGATMYVSYDIDVVERSFAPGTGNAMSSTGLRPSHLLEIAGVFAGMDLEGFDLVEVAPTWDPSGRTAGLAAAILLETMWPRLFEPAEF
jgi:arginase family enzyme